MLRKLIKALIQWTPSWLGTGFTLYALSQQDWFQFAVLSVCTGGTALWVSFSTAFMEEADKEAAKRGGTLAQWIFTLLDKLVDQSREGLVKSWQELTSNFKVKYYTRLNYLCRKLETHGLDKERVLKMEQIFVPVNVVRKSLKQISPNLLRKMGVRTPLANQNTIGTFLALMRRNPDYRRLAILGAPGSGKTTLLRYITLMYVIDKHRWLHPNAPKFIPALLYLRDIYHDILRSPNLSLAELLTRWVQDLEKNNPIQPPENWFARQLQHSRCLILLDGLDEIASENERQKVSQWVDQQMSDYKETAFILTSRPLGYEHAKLQQDVQVLEVQPLTDEQIERFVHNWYLDIEIEKQQREVDSGVQEDASRQADFLLEEIKATPALKEMATNPLLLTMIVTVHWQLGSLPVKRVDLYDEIFQVLLEKRQKAKRMSYILTASQKQAVLQPLALDLMYRKTRIFTLEEAQSFFQAKLERFPGHQLTPAKFLKQLQEVHALVAKEKEGIYEFSHRSFQEYLAAVEIKETSQEYQLVEQLQRPDELSWWADTMRLYAPKANATGLVQAILKRPTFESLVLACDFWRDRAELDPNVQRNLLQQLNQPLIPLEGDCFKFATTVQPRYFKLAHYLQTAQWEDADKETYEVMCQVIGKRGGNWDLEDIHNFLCEDLHTLDQLWVRYSRNRFGFSVQRDVYAEVGGKLDGCYDEAVWEKFCDCVKWPKVANWVDYKLTFYLTDITGHLPGIGVAWGVFDLGLGFEGWLSLLSHRALQTVTSNPPNSL